MDVTVTGAETECGDQLEPLGPLATLFTAMALLQGEKAPRPWLAAAFRTWGLTWKCGSSSPSGSCRQPFEGPGPLHTHRPLPVSTPAFPVHCSSALLPPSHVIRVLLPNKQPAYGGAEQNVVGDHLLSHVAGRIGINAHLGFNPVC